MEFYFKKHISGEKIVIGICDSAIIGKKFIDGEKALTVSEFFFKGSLANEGKILDIINQAHSINLVGKELVEVCLDLGIIKKENIQEILGVPYALILEINDK